MKGYGLTAIERGAILASGNGPLLTGIERGTIAMSRAERKPAHKCKHHY